MLHDLGWFLTFWDTMFAHHHRLSSPRSSVFLGLVVPWRWGPIGCPKMSVATYRLNATWWPSRVKPSIQCGRSLISTTATTVTIITLIIIIFIKTFSSLWVSCLHTVFH
jgi:hypothetical protein